MTLPFAPPSVPCLEHDEDTSFWTRCTGNDLEILMRYAQYSQSAKISGLAFNAANVAPFLGPRPREAVPRWRSFMTDDYSPVEYSWTWSAAPKVRYSFEPVGLQMSLASDPFNRAEPLKCAAGLHEALPQSNWTLFDNVVRDFYCDRPSKRVKIEKTPSSSSSPSSVFLALELGRKENEVGAKAYAIPVRAEQTGESRHDVLRQTITNLEKTPAALEYPAWPAWERYFNSRSQHSPLDMLGIAIDCVEPTLSRLKMYIRTQETSFESVRSMLTMHGSHEEWSSKNLADLRELWTLVLSLDDEFSDLQHLEKLTCETAGLLYNVCIQHGTNDIKTKIYIPVKRYGRNDKSIAEGLVKFLHSRERGQHGENFLRALEELCSYRKLEEGRGLQTYISVEVKQGELDLTSYLASEIYHPRRPYFN